MLASYKTIICLTLTKMLGDTSPKQFAKKVKRTENLLKL